MLNKLKNIPNAMLGILVILFLNVVIIASPFSIIWLVNWLFPIFSIPYSFLSWIVVVLINIGIFSLAITGYFKEKM